MEKREKSAEKEPRNERSEQQETRGRLRGPNQHPSTNNRDGSQNQTRTNGPEPSKHAAENFPVERESSVCIGKTACTAAPPAFQLDTCMQFADKQGNDDSRFLPLEDSETGRTDRGRPPTAHHRQPVSRDFDRARNDADVRRGVVQQLQPPGFQPQPSAFK